MDYQKPTNFTSLLEVADEVDALETSEVHLSRIRYVHRDSIGSDKLDANTDGEKIRVREESIYGYMLDLEKTILRLVIHTLLT